MKPETKLFGVMAEFDSVDALFAATRRARQAGYREMDAYTPYAVEGLAEELGERKTRVPLVVLIGGLVGAGAGFLMQYWTMAIDYPFNAGGRPLNSWPAYVPIAFEMLILVASFSAFLSMLFMNDLPRPHHPLFSVPQFARASQDRFFLCIESTDPQFDPERTLEFLSGSASHIGVVEVPMDLPSAPKEAEPSKQKPVAVMS
ncbi:MAG TPA: DUF3341 domain-containing protein [Planctomycetaceae bacterium]|nr:DUF3341 domain-containing protein [Planctomycetaceae bacterium]